MKPRTSSTRVTTLSIPHLGAWMSLLGKHAHGREGRAMAGGPHEELYVIVGKDQEEEHESYQSWRTSIGLGPQVYPLRGGDLLEAIARSKSVRKHIAWRMDGGAKLRFFDATKQHLTFAKNHLGVKKWGSQVDSCHPSLRKYTSKLMLRQLLVRMGMWDSLLPWVSIDWGGYGSEVVATRTEARFEILRANIKERGLQDVATCFMLKHPMLASAAGIKRVSNEQDILDFLSDLQGHPCDRLILEAGIPEHQSTSIQGKLTNGGIEILGYSTQLIEEVDGSYEYRGNVMVSSSYTTLIEPMAFMEMEAIGKSILLKLHELGVRGYAVIDFLVDKEDRVWPLEVNLRETATVYLRSLMDQVLPRTNDNYVAGVIRNVDIPLVGPKSFEEVKYRLDSLVHNGVYGVYPTMVETLRTDAPVLALICTGRSTSEAELMAEQAVRRLTLSDREVRKLLETKKMARPQVPSKNPVAS